MSLTQITVRVLYQEVCAYEQEMPPSQIVAQLLHVTYTDHSPCVVSRSMCIWPGNATITNRSTAIACHLHRSQPVCCIKKYVHMARKCHHQKMVAQLLHVTYIDHSPYVVSRSMYI